jgi:hypothetical protein
MTYYTNGYDKFFGMFIGVVGAVFATMLLIGSVADAGMIG